jgi:hypothetical protein
MSSIPVEAHDCGRWALLTPGTVAMRSLADTAGINGQRKE